MTAATYDFDPVTKKCTIRGASELPPEIFEIAGDIEILDASHGHLYDLPGNFGDLSNLRIAFFADNDFPVIPAVLAQCPRLEMVGFKSCQIDHIVPESLPQGLRGLILTDNEITELPESIGDLAHLQKLMLTGNRLETLPGSLLNLKYLELLRVSLNRLTESPDWLFQLPKLAWYGDAGNVFNKGDRQPPENFKQVRWQDLEIGEKLGESSKNTVYQVTWDGRDVAVKLFGAGITTDGASMDELNASLCAGEHPHIIGGLARAINGPDGREGLLMPLVPPEYNMLGQPPDFTTLTRDVYDEYTTYTHAFIMRVSADIADALEHLADRGVQHGDVYAHNILTRPDGSSYLGDMGAASLYEKGTAAGKLREQLDVRGFGYLLDDLLKNSENDDILAQLRDDCLNESPAKRPSFKEVCDRLTP